jgi:hypothetical protein
LARSLAGEPVGALSKWRRKQKSRMRLAYDAMMKIIAAASPHELVYDAMTKIIAAVSPHDLRITVIKLAV